MASADSPHAWRTSALTRFIFAAWGVVALRLIHLQWYQADELARLATRQSEVVVEVPARPADIVDRNGKLLVGSITSQSLFIDPKYFKVEPDFIRELADAVHLKFEDLSQRVDDYKDKRFMWVKRRLSDEEVDHALNLKWPKNSFGFREEFQRQYPQDELAAHVLGLRDIDGTAKAGVELSLDQLIRGKPGKRKLVKDARNRIVEVDYSPEDAPRQFQAVQLTLDLAIQMFAERELEKLCEEWKPSAATVIVMEPHSGELLALASRPTYSPNDLRDVPEEAWKNQAISIVYEPGSTFKPFIVAWGLQQKALTIDDTFNCHFGTYRMQGGREIRDVGKHGVLNVTDVLVKSSNIGMAQIGDRMKNEGLYAAVTRFGFGRPTGVELPGELSGILHPLEKWTSYSTGSIPMGQEIAVTPMQLAAAHCALANGGKLISPRVLKGVLGDGSEMDTTFTVSMTDPHLATPPQIVTSTVDENIADWIIREPMAEVVRRGTGLKARIPGYSVFGKTGTAQKYDPKTGGYSSKNFVVSFVGGAPVNDPKVIVLVVVDEPHTFQRVLGGKIAAPVAARILQRTLLHLRVPPDREERTATRFDEFDIDTLIE
jgi:cell division protein FtsI/penicillin-binding protein 2